MIDQGTINAGFVFLGIIGGTVYLCMSIFYHRIVENMKKDKETAITKFFLKEKTVKAFKILAVSGLILVLLFLTETFGIVTERPLIGTAARIAYPLPTLGLAYFSYTLQKVTRKN